MLGPRHLALLAVAALGAGLAWWAAPPRAPDTPADVPLPAALPDGPDRALRITTFGTSLTATYDWPARLQNTLAECQTPPPVVTVVARPGANVNWALGQVASVAATTPDLILIEFAINDADLRDGLSLQLARDQHIRLITGLKTAAPDAQIALMTMNPATGLRGWARPYLTAHYLAYRDLAAEMGTGLIDLYPRWLARPADARGLDADGLHPDPKIAAEVIVPNVVGYLGCAELQP